MTDRELMQQALEALESDNPDIQLRAAIALRQALETEQESVECMCVICKLGKREWVGLTDEEIITHFQTDVNTGSLLSFADGARYGEAKLKEKNDGRENRCFELPSLNRLHRSRLLERGGHESASVT